MSDFADTPRADGHLVFGFAALAALVGMCAIRLLSGAEFVTAFSWLVSIVLLGKPAALLAQGWTAQALIKARQL